MRANPAFVLAFVLCGPTACAAGHTEANIDGVSARTAARAVRVPIVFDYSATDFEFGYSLTLRADRRWTRSEHSGSAIPAGRLSPVAMRRFTAILAAAPFEQRMVDCEFTVGSQSTIHDRERDRSVSNEQAQDAEGSWIPCGLQADERTDALIGCLESLIDDEHSAYGCDDAGL